MKSLTKMSLAVFGLSLMANAAGAATMIGLAADKQVVYDSQWKSTGIYNDGNWFIRAGNGGVTIQRAMVVVVQLPTLEQMGAGNTFTSADFRLQLLSTTGSTDSTTGSSPVPDFNLDLYAVRVSDASTVLASDFYAGSAVDSKATLIQDNFVTPSSPLRSDDYVSTGEAGDAQLLAYLIAAWDNGNNAGKYVFLRLSPDYTAPSTPNMNYTLVTGDAGSANERPTITYTVGVAQIPEPASAGLLAGTGVLLLTTRRTK